MTDVIGIGSARLKVIGLTPQNIASSSEGRVPGRATFTGMKHQKTGLGERLTHISAMTIPHVIGGLDALDWLIRHQAAQETVEYIRLGERYLGRVEGPVVLRYLDYDEEGVHPFTGIGRKIEVDVELVHVE